MTVRDQVNILIHLAATDNKVTENETRLIHMIGQANGMQKEDIDNLIKRPEPAPDLNTLTPDQKFEHLYHIVQLMKVDGQIFKSEIVFCENVAERLGYKKGVIAELSTGIFSDPTITSDRTRLKEKAQKYLK